MVGLLLYGYCRGIYSSRRLALACQQNVSFMYLTGRATPDFRTIAVFRKRFRQTLQGYFGEVLALCRTAGLVRSGPPLASPPRRGTGRVRDAWMRAPLEPTGPKMFTGFGISV